MLECKDSLLVFAGKFDSDLLHPELGLIRRGTISCEYYWLNRWYNVFRFHEPDGRFRNYYCNINMPPVCANGVLDYVDLDIDILVQDDFSYKVLDMDEYETSATAFEYSSLITSQVDKALNELVTLIETREFPFDAESACRRSNESSVSSKCANTNDSMQLNAENIAAHGETEAWL